MERLTKRLNDGKALCIDVCGEKCIEGHEWCPDCEPFVNVMKKLAEYEDLEEQGLLLRLPCKVGDNVYCLTSAKTKIVETSILWIEKHSNCLVFALAGGFGDVVSAKLGETWFLTKEEAEQALAKMKEGVIWQRK